MNFPKIEDLNAWVERAGEEALLYFDQKKSQELSIKKDGSPLTQADLKSHEILFKFFFSI